MAHREIVNGNFQWNKDKTHCMWHDDPNGEYQKIRLRYNLWEKLLVLLHLKKDFRHEEPMLKWGTTKTTYATGIDPYDCPKSSK